MQSYIGVYDLETLMKAGIVNILEALTDAESVLIPYYRMH